jgi:DNA-binding NarL/FixJ family response regulator
MGLASEVLPANRTRILIADDDRLFAEMLRCALVEHDDFEVVGVFENGAEAVSGSESLKPSLVLMDVSMPVLDGIAATRQLRELADPPIVVLITGEESEANGRSAYEAGAAAYLRKSQELVTVIDVIVAVSRLSTAEVA